MTRKLSFEFIEDLKTGNLKQILDLVKLDPTLDLNIRGNYVNIYYRGGNILKISEIKPHIYSFWFDPDYQVSRPSNEIANLKTHLENRDWLYFFPFAKQAMDFYFAYRQSEEREFAQLVVRDNNYSGVSNGTDYFIIDYEYNNHKGAQFDLVSVVWTSNTQHRKTPNKHKPKLIVMEMKYGDGAFKGKAGMIKHVKDFIDFLASPGQVISFKKEMVDLFKQKRELGLVRFGVKGNKNHIEEFDEKIEMVFLIANHDPESKVLKEVLLEVNELFPSFDVKVLSSNFLGYGLYTHLIKTLNPDIL
jgi:hypothetical protein